MEGSVVLLTGGTGTCKTIFALQFLMEGLKKGESCVYLTLEESAEDIKADARQFGWDFEKYEEKGLVKIVYHDPFETDVAPIISTEIANLKAKRLVMDSVSIMGFFMKDAATVRKQIGKLVEDIKKTNCVSLLISEIGEDTKKLSRFGVEEFIADGVIVLNYLGIGQETNRSLMIRKMRRTSHGKDVYPFKLTSKGIKIVDEEVGLPTR